MEYQVVSRLYSLLIHTKLMTLPTETILLFLSFVASSDFHLSPFKDSLHEADSEVLSEIYYLSMFSKIKMSKCKVFLTCK